MKHIRSLLALILCLTLILSASIALAAAPTFSMSRVKVKSGDEATLTVTPKSPGFLTLKVVYENGSEVMTLFDNYEVHTKANELTFDAVYPNGDLMTPGEYKLEGVLVDQFGESSKATTAKLTVEEPDIDVAASSPAGSSAVRGLGAISAAASSAGTTTSVNTAPATGATGSAAKPAAPVVVSDVMTYTSGTGIAGSEGLLIGVGVSDTAEQSDAGYWTLPADASAEQIWAAIVRPIVNVNVDETESAYIYDSVKESRKKLGTISGKTQGVNVIAERNDGWSLIEAFRKEDGAFVRGYIRSNKLRTTDVNQTYGIVIDKKAQTLTVYKDGARIGSCAVTTGLPTPKYPHRETPAGEFITGVRRGTIEYYGMGYTKHTIRLNDNFYIAEIPTTKKNGTDYSMLAGSLGIKATRGNICVAHDASTDGGINAEWIWNMTTENKKVKVLVLDDKERNQVPVSVK